MAPPNKKRKTGQPEEIIFDPAARQDYLTGFHKRKEARKKHAQEVAAKLEKEERVSARKQLREQRKVDLEQHIAEFNAELKKQNPDLIDPEEGDEDEDAGEWAGIEDAAEAVRDEDEYVDEDKYTTVTVEPMAGEESEDEESKAKAAAAAKERENAESNSKSAPKKRPWSKNKTDDGKGKPKKKKFRYETKAERQITRQKQKNSSRAAKARRKAGDKDK